MIIQLTHKLPFQDFQDLSEGLEGRSRNQLALLMDTLLHPNADIGELHPSTLSWKHDQSQHISHVVIGDGKPGGSWHGMNGDIQSLSLGSWLEIPPLPFQDWIREKQGAAVEDLSMKRVSLGTVAEYYTDFVSKMNLESNMMNGVRVTKVRECPPPVVCSLGSPKFCTSPTSSLPSPASTTTQSPCNLSFHTVDSGLNLSERSNNSDKYFELTRDSSTDYSSSSSDSDDDGVSCGNSKKKCDEYRWCLKGSCGQEDVVVFAKNLVLASGVSENPRRLGVNGEDSPLVSHHFSKFYQKLESIDRTRPVVIIGAGLSAADAVLMCLSRGLRVTHVFRQDPKDPSLVYNKMPHSIYPEYRRVLKLMQGIEHDELYKVVSQSEVCEFTKDFCIVVNTEGKKTYLCMSLVGVFIGSEAKLSFLPKRIRSRLSVDPSRPINAKTNPIDVDPVSFESDSFPSLYALGPLAGDHFVRFVLGSGVGVCRHLLDKLQS